MDERPMISSDRRIGVIVFHALVMVGRMTSWIKVARKKSGFFLVHINSWAAFGMPAMITTISRDVANGRYDLHPSDPAEIDIDNYLEISDKILPLLHVELELVERQMQMHAQNNARWVVQLDPTAFRAQMDERVDHFLHRSEAAEWLSWTWADQRTYGALKARHKPGMP